MGKSILRKFRKHTFSDYFELDHPVKEIVEEFGYQYSFEELTLPGTKREITSLARLRETFLKKLPFITLNSEIAKRTFFLAPLLLEILDYIQVEINVEYPLDAGDHLNGSLDYLIRYAGTIVIVEARKGNMERGFNQLAATLIALDRHEESPLKTLYGAVTTGDMWRFGILQRQEKMLKKDMNGYILPANLEELFSVLLGILGYGVSI